MPDDFFIRVRPDGSVSAICSSRVRAADLIPDARQSRASHIEIVNYPAGWTGGRRYDQQFYADLTPLAKETGRPEFLLCLLPQASYAAAVAAEVDWLKAHYLGCDRDATPAERDHVRHLLEPW